MKYSIQTINKACELRRLGNTYGEIKTILNLAVPKSTLSEWCQNISLPPEYSKRINKLNLTNLSRGRQIAVEMNKIKREKFLTKIDNNNLSIAKMIHQIETAKIALAMLCLGEASKYNRKTRTCFSLGNSDPRIIVLFLNLLKLCFDFNINKVRCTVQCRADQNIGELENYWRGITAMPKKLFYKTRIDPRTIGKPTKKSNYKGVLKVDYFDTKVQLDLESLANLIYNEAR